MSTSESRAETPRAWAPHHLALGVHEPERVAAFYTTYLRACVCHTHLDPDGETRAIWLRFGDSPLILMLEHTLAPPRPRGQGVEPGLFLLALGLPPQARAEVEAELEQAGCPIEARTAFTSYVRDPEGNRVGLSSYVF